MSLIPGVRLGPYEVLAPLGAGGMGEVWKARDARLGREAAIKVLPPSYSRDPDRLRRFEQEAKAAGLLNHPNITAVHDIGMHEGAPYIVTELLEGETRFTSDGRMLFLSAARRDPGKGLPLRYRVGTQGAVEGARPGRPSGPERYHPRRHDSGRQELCLQLPQHPLLSSARRRDEVRET